MALLFFGVLGHGIESRAQAERATDLRTLSQSSSWLRFLRYERAFFGLKSSESAVRDSNFFFSASGRTDAYAELVATIEALKRPMSEFSNPNQHPACRFPARFKWLNANLPLNLDERILLKCGEYQKWRSHGKISSISVYFATGYFGNPASFFGHPLLKFNVGEGESHYLDSSLNYGANTPNNENPLPYVLKGLFGGYAASFTRHDFFYHDHNYGETELRDLWEYRLNLNQSEIDYIVDHTWELLGRKLPYFFLVDNCAFRIGELLEGAFGQKLFVRNKLYFIPIDLFANLADGKKADGQPLVSAVNQVPSRYSRLSRMYNSLSPGEKSEVKFYVSHPNELKGMKARVAETLVNYYSYRKIKNPGRPEFAERRTDVIREQFQIAEKPVFNYSSERKPLAPHLGQNSFNLRALNVFSNAGKTFQEFEIRPALYDELNPAIGHPNNADLIVFDTRFRLRDEKFSLRSLDLLKVSSFSTSKIDLPDDGGLSWTVQSGLKSIDQSCQNCLAAAASGGVGWTRTIVNGLNLYVLAKSGLQNNRLDRGTLWAGPEVGGFIEPFNWWKISVKYEYEVFLNGLKSKTDIWKLEQRFGSSRTWDFRIEYHQMNDKQLGLNFGLYI